MYEDHGRPGGPSSTIPSRDLPGGGSERLVRWRRGMCILACLTQGSVFDSAYTLARQDPTSSGKYVVSLQDLLLH